MMNKFTKKIVIFSSAFLIIVFLWTGVGKFIDLKTMVGIQTVYGENRYGILGQTAPELDLTTWIDENGKAMYPIYLSDLRGKVIYLYFFQDW